MDLSFLSDYALPVIVGLCLCIGYIVKKWVADVDNRWIPTILMVVGVALSIWINAPDITPEVLLQGAISGLIAVGVHQEGKTLLKGGKSHESA